MEKPLPDFSLKKARAEGWAWLGSRLLEGQKLADFLAEKADFDQFEKALAALDGEFSAVVETEKATWLGGDRLRHFPLFYAEIAGKWAVSASAFDLFEALKRPAADPFLQQIFFETGFVTGPRTLVAGLFSLEAGQAVCLEKGLPPERRFYFDFAKIDGEKAAEKDVSPAALARRLDDIFERFYEKNRGRPLAVPLSGGFDSRLVAVMLKKFGRAEDALFFTYGRSKNPEFEAAKRVADRLGLRWLPIEYDRLPLADFLKNEDLRGWLDAGFGLQSMPFLQDWPAVFWLKSQNLIEKETIFVPGHSGDMLAGSHLTTKHLGRSQPLNVVAEAIVERHFSNFRGPKTAFQKDVFEQIAHLENAPPHLIFESWDIRERQSKYIVNSARAFSALGFEAATPLWDEGLIRFFQAAPFEAKWQKRLYDQTLPEHFFEPFCVDFSTAVQDSFFKQRLQKAKKPLKKLLPSWILAHLTQGDDFFCYREMVGQLLKEAGGRSQFLRPAQPNFYNAELAQWMVWRHFRGF